MLLFTEKIYMHNYRFRNYMSSLTMLHQVMTSFSLEMLVENSMISSGVTLLTGNRNLYNISVLDVHVGCFNFCLFLTPSPFSFN